MGYRTYLATHMLIEPGNSAKHWPVKPFERIPEKLVEEQMTKLDALTVTVRGEGNVRTDE
jgi:hypothetical protein